MIKRSIVVAIVLSLVYAVAVFAAPNYQEGLWEITTTVNMQGMPKAMMKPVTHQVCMTKENAVPQPKERGKEKCKITDQHTAGNKVFWTMTCEDGTISTGEIAYSKTSFKGSQTTKMSHGGKPMTMKSTMNGKYLGPCTK